MNLSFTFTLILMFLFAFAGCATSQKDGGVKAEKPDQQVQTSSKENEDAVKKEESSPVVEVTPREEQKRPVIELEPIPVEKSVEEPAAVADVDEIKQKVEEAKVTEESSTTKESTAVKEEKVQESPKLSKEQVEEKLVPTTSSKEGEFTVTVASKDESHPYFGKGYPEGFVLDGVQGKEIVMERNKSYTINVQTNPKHDVYLSTKEIGWGSTPWVKGVEGMFTYKGKIIVSPDKNTPLNLYYSCRNHPYMGGKIHIVNPGETVNIKQAKVSKAAVSKKPQATEKVTSAKVNQKLMFANMMLNSKSAKRVQESGMQEAIDLQKQAIQLIASAEAKLKSGDNAAAFTDAENALDTLKKSSRLAPNEDQMKQLKNRYQELLTSIADYEKSHATNVKRISKSKGAEAAVPYDVSKVEDLKASAKQFAEKGDYTKANKNVENAQHIITVALQKMLESQTLVYDLNFETPKDEYEYELKRFGGYEELIPVAIEAKKPTEGAIQLMKGILAKAQKMRDKAEETAGKGDYPTAIRMMIDATKTVRRALRMVGVMQ